MAILPDAAWAVFAQIKVFQNPEHNCVSVAFGVVGPAILV
jgi:hypothetical protein